MVSKLKNYVTEGEKAENEIRRCKEETGLSLKEMEKAWERVKKLPAGRVIDKETRVSIQKLKECEAIVGEAKKTTAAIAQETGTLFYCFKKGCHFNREEEKEGRRERRENWLKQTCGWLSALPKSIRAEDCNFWI